MKYLSLFSVGIILTFYSSAQYQGPIYNDPKYKNDFTYYTSYWGRMLDEIKNQVPDSLCFNQLNSISFNIDTAGNVINYEFGTGSKKIWFVLSMVHYGSCAEKDAVKSITRSSIFSKELENSIDTHFVGVVEFRGGPWHSFE